MKMKKSIFIIFLLIGILLPIPLVRASPGWLPGWGRRVKFTFNYTDINEVLTNFTGLIHLSNSSAGENDEDLSFVFDEVGASYLKIAVTTDDGITEIYVDVDYWDATLEIAYLHAGQHPSLSNVTGTDGYLYYDGMHVNNTDYVGLSGSVPAEKAWDDNYVMVLHMRDNTTSSILDSTSNDNDGTKLAANEPIEADGKIANAQDFDGDDDYIDCGNDNSIRITGSITLEAWVRREASQPNTGVIAKYFGPSPQSYVLFMYSDKTGLLLSPTINGDNRIILQGDTALTQDVWHHIVGVYDGVDARVYLDGNLDITPVNYTLGIYNSTRPLELGRHTSPALPSLNGILDEPRISNVARSAAWIKASYESGRDHINDFGSEELREGLFDHYLTVYFHTGIANVYTNTTLRANGTEVGYDNGQVANVTSVIESGYLFLEHIYDSAQTRYNPLFLTMNANYTCSAYAYEEPSGWGVLTLVAIFFVSVVMIGVKTKW